MGECMQNGCMCAVGIDVCSQEKQEGELVENTNSGIILESNSVSVLFFLR